MRTNRNLPGESMREASSWNLSRHVCSYANHGCHSTGPRWLGTRHSHRKLRCCFVVVARDLLARIDVPLGHSPHGAVLGLLEPGVCLVAGTMIHGPTKPGRKVAWDEIRKGPGILRI